MEPTSILRLNDIVSIEDLEGESVISSRSIQPVPTTKMKVDGRLESVSLCVPDMSASLLELEYTKHLKIYETDYVIQFTVEACKHMLTGQSVGVIYEQTINNNRRKIFLEYCYKQLGCLEKLKELNDYFVFVTTNYLAGSLIDLGDITDACESIVFDAHMNYLCQGSVRYFPCNRQHSGDAPYDLFALKPNLPLHTDPVKIQQWMADKVYNGLPVDGLVLEVWYKERRKNYYPGHSRQTSYTIDHNRLFRFKPRNTVDLSILVNMMPTVKLEASTGVYRLVRQQVIGSSLFRDPYFQAQPFTPLLPDFKHKLLSNKSRNNIPVYKYQLSTALVLPIYFHVSLLHSQGPEIR